MYHLSLALRLECIRLINEYLIKLYVISINMYK